MYLLGSEGEIVPCYLDEGRGYIVVKIEDFLDDCDYVSLVIDEEEYEIHGDEYDIVEETRRVIILAFDCDYFDDEDEESSEGSESDWVDEEEESSSCSEQEIEEDYPESMFPQSSDGY